MSDGITFGRGGLPVRIESFASMDDKRRYRIVRSDNLDPVPGDIVTAMVDTGDCTLSIRRPGAEEPEVKTENFGADGIRIVRR